MMTQQFTAYNKHEAHAMQCFGSSIKWIIKELVTLLWREQVGG